MWYMACSYLIFLDQGEMKFLQKITVFHGCLGPKRVMYYYRILFVLKDYNFGMTSLLSWLRYDI